MSPEVSPSKQQSVEMLLFLYETKITALRLICIIIYCMDFVIRSMLSGSEHE